MIYKCKNCGAEIKDPHPEYYRQVGNIVLMQGMYPDLPFKDLIPPSPNYLCADCERELERLQYNAHLMCVVINNNVQTDFKRFGAMKGRNTGVNR